MKTSIRSVALIAVAIGIITAACNMPGLKKDFDYGKVANGTYTNDYFGFSMPAPAGDWYVKDKSYMDSIQDIDYKQIAGGNKKKKMVLDASRIITANLLSLTYKEEDGKGSSSTSLIVLATHQFPLAPIKNDTDYLNHLFAVLRKAGINYEKDGAIAQEKIGGRTFYAMPVKIEMSGTDLTLRQKYYSSQMGDFFFGFILTYFTDDQYHKLGALLQKAEFKDKN